MGKYCPIEDKEMSHVYCNECDSKVCEDTFFCLVVGSRSINNYELIKKHLDKLLINHKKVAIVSGGARGVDSLAKRYAMERKYFYKEFKADWDNLGKRAGFIRNRVMHQYLSKQKMRGCVAFWDGQSKGTADNFRLAKEFQIEIRIIKIEGV